MKKRLRVIDEMIAYIWFFIDLLCLLLGSQRSDRLADYATSLDSSTFAGANT